MFLSGNILFIILLKLYGGALVIIFVIMIAPKKLFSNQSIIYKINVKIHSGVGSCK
jgi:hypothetical protein